MGLVLINKMHLSMVSFFGHIGWTQCQHSRVAKNRFKPPDQLSCERAIGCRPLFVGNRKNTDSNVDCFVGKQVGVERLFHAASVPFFSELCWGKAMVAYTMPQQRKNEESERLRGERDLIKFIDLGFERWQVVRFSELR